jgi:hypothetical protein
MKKIETNVSHITKAGSNIFLDLGFSKEEAEEYQKESQRRINMSFKLKKDLMNEIIKIVEAKNLSLSDLQFSKKEAKNLKSLDYTKFTFDKLIEVLLRIKHFDYFEEMFL